MTNSLHAEEEKKVRQTVTNFLLSAINISNLNNDDNLFESGIVNSLFAVQLMTFLEKTFVIEVGMDDLDIENFKSVNATTGFVMRKKGRTRLRLSLKLCRVPVSAQPNGHFVIRQSVQDGLVHWQALCNIYSPNNKKPGTRISKHL